MMAARPLRSPTGKPIRLAPTRPNIGVAVAYQAKLDRLIAAMQRDTTRAVERAYRQQMPRIASDASPTAELQREMRELGKKWLARFDEFAATEAKKFSRDSAASADRSFRASLKKAGFTVDFKITAPVRNVLNATMAEQVGLIKSIPEQFHKNIEGIVMRGVQVGRDQHSISEALQAQYGVTNRRAAFIARDQNNKATAAIVRTRQQELDLTTAEWVHSSGGKKPRPEHVAFNGHSYDIKKGAYLEGVWTWPGYEINCRCVARTIIPGIN